MVKFNQYQRSNFQQTLFSLALVLLMNGLSLFSQVDARQRGDDIIMTKGKLIVRGGRGRGNLILDTGGHKSSEGASMMPMMPMMAHHFSPYSFYPMQHQEQHHSPMIIHPIYMEDHSGMHQHHEPHHESSHEPQHESHHDHHEYHHQEEPQHYEHEQHHEPEHHQQHYEMQHHQPMEHNHHYEHEGGEEGGHGGHSGYETHPMMSMMMHGSGLQPTYQQMALQLQHQQQQQLNLQPALIGNQYQGQQLPFSELQQQEQSNQVQMNQVKQAPQVEQEKQQEAVASGQQNNKVSLISQSASNNPLIAMIKPLFKRTAAKQQQQQKEKEKKVATAK